MAGGTPAVGSRPGGRYEHDVERRIQARRRSAVRLRDGARQAPPPRSSTAPRVAARGAAGRAAPGAAGRARCGAASRATGCATTASSPGSTCRRAGRCRATRRGSHAGRRSACRVGRAAPVRAARLRAGSRRAEMQHRPARGLGRSADDPRQPRPRQADDELRMAQRRADQRRRRQRLALLVRVLQDQDEDAVVDRLGHALGHARTLYLRSRRCPSSRRQGGISLVQQCVPGPVNC